MKIEQVQVLGSDKKTKVSAGHFSNALYDTYLNMPVDVELTDPYVIHGYVKSASSGSITISVGSDSSTYTTKNEWLEVIMKISKINSQEINFIFSKGEYWIYNWKLEKGSNETAWTPSPLDAKFDLIQLGSEVTQLSDKIEQKVWQTEIDAASKTINESISRVGQDAKKIYWLIDENSKTQASMSLTKNAYTLIAENINLTGKVTFGCFDSDAQKRVTDVEGAAKSAQDSANSATSAANNAQNTADGIIKNIYTNGTTTIDGGIITTESITADKLSVKDLSALQATIAGWDITTGALTKVFTDENKNLYQVSIKTTTDTNYNIFQILKGTSTEGYNKNPIWSVDSFGYMTVTSGKIGDWYVKGQLQSDSYDSEGYLIRSWMAAYKNDDTWIYSLQKATTKGSNPTGLSPLWVVYGNGNEYCQNSTVNKNLNVNGNSTIYGDLNVGGNFKLYGHWNSSRFDFANGGVIYNDSNQDFRIYPATVESSHGFRFGVDYADGSVLHGWNFSCCGGGTADIGTSDDRWDTIYAQTGEINTSDRNQKHNILELDEDTCIKITQMLKPSSYVMNNNTSGRTHYGFIAQDIEEMLDKLDIDTNKFAAFIKSPKNKIIYKGLNKKVEPVDSEYNYALRYTEFIPIAFKTLQYCLRKISEQQNEIDMLKINRREEINVLKRF